jgi:DNA-binding CsgD family transcriptional regulator
MRGWFADAQQWLCATAREAGYEPVGPVEQFRIWCISSVLRVPATEGMIYFKVSSGLPLFVNEALVTRCLGSLFPEFVSAPLAIDAGRGWLALADFGEEVGWEAPAEVKIEVFRRFAQLQIASAAHIDRLLEAGCVDRRLDWLADQQPAWFTGPQARQRLSMEEFSQLQACSAGLPALSAELASCGVPDALLHGDIHPGNIARNERGYTFFDWTDAAVGHPFLDMIAIATEDDAHTAEAMRAAYLAEWATVTGPEPAERAWELAVVLMAANQAITYLSLASSIDPPDQDMAAAVGQWLRRLITCASELPHNLQLASRALTHQADLPKLPRPSKPDHGSKLAEPATQPPTKEQPAATRALLMLLRPHPAPGLPRRRAPPPPVPRLTPRQTGLLHLVAAGHSNRQIARRLGISDGTVRTHLEKSTKGCRSPAAPPPSSAPSPTGSLRTHRQGLLTNCPWLHQI